MIINDYEEFGKLLGSHPLREWNPDLSTSIAWGKYDKFANRLIKLINSQVTGDNLILQENDHRRFLDVNFPVYKILTFKNYYLKTMSMAAARNEFAKEYVLMKFANKK